MKKQIVHIRGMHCRSCEILMEENLKKINGVKSAVVSYKNGQAVIFFDDQEPSLTAISQAVKDAGYEVGIAGKLPLFSQDIQDYKNLLVAALMILGGYAVARWFGLFDINPNTSSDGVFISLLVGLVAGVSSCMALIGGLVLALAARHAEAHPEATTAQKFRPHLFFNLGRVVGFGIFGGLIGLVGSVVKPSTVWSAIFTVIIGLVMIGLGLKLIEIFPFLKDKTITLPKKLARFFGLKNEQKEYSHGGAFITGALTFFLPCGFTQAMQLYAISTGSFWRGAWTMSLFAMGTSLGLLGIGWISSVMKGKRARIFFATAGLLVILFGIYNITNASRVILQTSGTSQVVKGTGNNTNGQVQEVKMTQKSNGYFPNTFTVKKGVPVKWIITSETTFSCASYISMPKYGVSQALNKGENIITFTPTEVGELPFTCSMGMYRGKFIVVDGDSALSAPSTNQISVSNGGCSATAGGGGCGGCGFKR